MFVRKLSGRWSKALISGPENGIFTFLPLKCRVEQELHRFLSVEVTPEKKQSSFYSV